MHPIPPPRDAGFTTTTPVPLYWVEYGPPGASPLLVLHGGPGAHHDYLLPQMLDLARDHELILYDQRGGGRSKIHDRTAVTWHDHVEDLDRVIAEFHLERPTIVGYSWGALLAMLHAIEAAAGRARHPAGRLVLIDPAPVTHGYRRTFEAEFSKRSSGVAVTAMRTELAASGLREHDPDAYRQRNFEIGVASYFADPSSAHDLTPFRVTGRVQQSVWTSLGAYDLLAPGQLDTVKVPSIVIHGRQDPIPIESSELAARALGARFVAIDDAGHVPYVERPHVLFEAIRYFLAHSSVYHP